MENVRVAPQPADLQGRLTELMLRDERRLQRRLDGAHTVRNPKARAAKLGAIAADIDTAQRRVEQRRSSVPTIGYPPALPVSQRKDDILAAIRDHQVVIVAGETGSGKTTQLPKVCLELGRGVRGLIGHTQPRRIAARTVAERIAEELGTPLGSTVGYTVRFTDHVREDTLVKVMTDGILLAEIQRDRLLSAYDTLIIDEAHERSLNIDFILGYVKSLLPSRPDLKVVITSATIDTERFASHFDNAPIVEVSGRTYPVEVRYRPVNDPDDEEAEDRDQIQAICDAVEELASEGPGDALVFLSGEREIRDTADALAALKLRSTEILPLYARLSSAEQHRVFQPRPASMTRRIVLATNVAETSLTVPGIRYVVDPGTARISRYSLRTKVQRLPIEAIAQASANQRAGRCGRVAEGICIRLYSEEDFLSRPEFTDPEILRTNLASVILAMAATGLGEVEAFPFLDPPDRRSIRDGVALLHELGALDPTEQDPHRRLTPLGRRISALPIDPRLARMVLEADRNGCVQEVLVIAAALSIQDPRERPVDKQEAAAEKHRRFAVENSDFLAYLQLWSYLREKQEELSSSQFRKLCKAEFLHFLRVREWQDLHGQLRAVCKSLGISASSISASSISVSSAPDAPDRIHMSLLAGLLSHIGLKDATKKEYAGARGARFAVSPGSALFKKPPAWVMAGELVETTRLWARVVARIEPEWVEGLAGHLVKRSYSEPHWEMKRGAVVAYEKVTLYGVPIVAARKVGYGRIDPVLSRELFIRHALVEGDWRTQHRFFHDNRELLKDVEDLEHRARRRDILVDDETLFDFYDERIGAEVVSGRHFDSWWKKVRRAQPDLLTFSASTLVNAGAGGISADDYPDTWEQGDLRLALTYRFEPGTADDGVTVHIPLPVLNRVRDEGFDWQVHGLRENLVTALIRSLPKPARRNFVPVPDHARAVLSRVSPGGEPLLDALERELRVMSGVAVPREAWDLDRVPDHLRMTFRVVDADGKDLAEGKDLAALKRRLAGQMRVAISAGADSVERSGLIGWTIGALPNTFEEARGGQVIRGYPALVDEGDSVAVRILGTEAEQSRAMWSGTRRLLLLNVSSPVRVVQARLGTQAKLALSHNPHASVAALLEDCVVCAADRLIEDCGGPAWDEDGFTKLLACVRESLDAAATDVVGGVERILALAHDLDRRLRGTSSLTLLPALTDMRGQLSGLVYPGFVTGTGLRRLPDVARYLRGIERRLDKLSDNPGRDRERMRDVEQVQLEYRALLDRLPPDRRSADEVQQIRWMLEELRVSLFAQILRTPYPVSTKRILRAMDNLTP